MDFWKGKMLGGALVGIFDFVNSLPQADIAAAANLTRARDGKSFACPDCGNGLNGGKGDGLVYRERGKSGRPNWWCPGCQKNFSNVDVIATAEGISLQGELARRLSELFPFEEKRNDATSVGRLLSTNTPARAAEKNYSATYDFWGRKYSLKKFIDSQGGLWRGFDYDFLKSVGALFCPEYFVGGGEKAPVIILPYDETIYFWREVGGSRRGVPKGSQRNKFYVARPISGNVGIDDAGNEYFASANFIFEGELDALSLEQAFIRGNCQKYLDDIGILATGGKNFTRGQIESLVAKYGAAKYKPKFLVAYDNDKDGVDASKRLVDTLTAAGFYARAGFFGKVGGKKIDANDLLQQGAEVLIRAAFDLIDIGGF